MADTDRTDIKVIGVPRYCPTNSYVIESPWATVLVDTGLPSTFSRFVEALRKVGLSVSDVTHMISTHYHPDHVGLMPRLMSYGISLVAFGVQAEHLHDADYIFARDVREHANLIDDDQVLHIGIADSRRFLGRLGIGGEVVSLPSHSPDSIGIMLDTGDALVGDLMPRSWLDIDGDVPEATDWGVVLSRDVRVVRYGHVPSERIDRGHHDRRGDK